MVCVPYHYCNVDAPKNAMASTHSHCSPTTTFFFNHMFFFGLHYVLLQLAFLVMGPEDPHMQWLGLQAGPGNPSCALPNNAPTDSVIVARVLPAIALCLFHILHSSWDSESIYWQSLLLDEVIMLVCNAMFWLHYSRRARAADVLLRHKYWHRLLHHGFIPTMMLFWIFCMMGVADLQLLHSTWHVIVAFFAHSLLRTVLLGESTAPSAKVLDLTSHNPNVAHILLGSVALIVLPTAGISASFDWCSLGAENWPTISSATLCESGSYFVAIISVPAFTGVAAVFWLVASTSDSKKANFHGTCDSISDMGSWMQRLDTSHNQLSLGKGLGCFLGYGGAFFGLAAALIMKGSPFQNVLQMFCSALSIVFLMIAMILTVLSSDSSARGYNVRRSITLFLCLPVMALHLMLVLSTQSVGKNYHAPRSGVALAEYADVLCLSLWPLTWASEVQQTWQRNSCGKFHWPTTTFRFV